ncbi:NYN domain-containing protein [Limnoglobus roseus]|uniref:NYN domain-containing protein n=1 Tax=Limnoglobus roseus TaxID=2598579 RepID=A0A5C1AIX6_9BACT|nr:NYN domain-containing protein [Limnoglobus roseus]QEL19111.1 NYN domain-containing protein [Limnoglobus roseus]
MKTQRAEEREHTLAVFIDFENLAHGFNGRRDRFEIGRVLERLVEKGKIVVKKAYCDWSRFGTYTGPLHESAIELIEIPKRSQTGKNSADIRLVVDAIDLAYSKDHIDTFCIVSGDSDFSPLVSKLKELGKHVIGLGLANATSELLRDNCDEFIYYEDLGRAPAVVVAPAAAESMSEQKQKMFTLLIDSLLALRRENKELIYSSMVKDTMKRKKPSFNEGYYGYNTFSELLEDAQKQGLIDIEKSSSSGTYVVVRFGNEPKTPRKAREAEVKKEAVDRGARPRGRTRGEGQGRRPRADAVPPPVKPISNADDDAAEDLNEVPTYRPRVAPKPPADVPPPLPVEARKPAPPPVETRKPVPPPVAETPKVVRAEQPAEAPRRRPSVPPQPAPLPPIETPKRPPAPPKTDFDGFGAGLDID